VQVSLTILVRDGRQRGLKLVVPLFPKHLLNLELTSLIHRLERSSMFLLFLLHGDGCGALQLSLAWLACWYSSQYQSVSFWSSLVFDNAPELRVAQSSALTRVGVNTGQDPETVVPFMIFP
jgi:hypothetical protein